MVSFQELRDCEPGVFGVAAQRWSQLTGLVTDRGNDLDGQLRSLAEWDGAAGDGARATLGELRGRLRDMSDPIGRIGPILAGYHQDLADTRDRLRQALNAARENLLEVRSDGTVIANGTVAAPPGRDPAPPSRPGDPPPAPGAPLDKNELAARLTGDIRELVRKATEADGHTADALRRLTAQATGFAPAADDPTVAASAQRIPTGGPPAEVRAWWDSLSPADKESLLFSRASEIGGLDGIPASVRDRAKRSLLAEQHDRLTEERIRLQGKETRTPDEQSRLDDINGKLAGIEAIEKRLATPPSVAQPQAFLLKISADGNGRAIVAMGDPDTAANVATYVPGTGSRLASCAGELDRSDRMAYAATRAGSPSTSVITWVGYEAPQSIVPEAAEEKYALGAEKDLQRFQDGLRATHEGAPSHNTVIGHSYGTTTVGFAARDGGLNADDVVFLASPGVGVNNVDGLHLTGVDPGQVGSHIHSATAEHDIIRLADGSFGPAPIDAGFGGQTFSSAPGTEGPWILGGLSGEAHSQYWDHGNVALDNMGLVIAGKPTQ